MADDLVLNEFESDTHRRVCANLSVPRSAEELAAFLSKHDPHVDASAYGAASVQDFIDDLEAEGLVANVGSFESAADAVAAVRDDADLIDFPKAKAENFAERAEREDVFPYLDGDDHYVMTALALAKIEGPIPDEPPPLTGPALRAAEKENARLKEEADERAREGMLAAAERLREEAERLEKEAKK